MALAISGAVVGAQGADQAFVTKLAGVGMAEVELGTLAKDKAVEPRGESASPSG